jgi:hypothetical protein
MRAARRSRDPKGAERVRQLSEEIDGLTRAQAHIQEELQTLRAHAARTAAAASAQAGAR